MKRIIIFAVAAVAAAAPAAGGLLGNQSFASSVPVRGAAAGPAAVSRSVTPLTATPAGDDKGKAKHGADDPAGDNHGKAKHGADDPAGDNHGGRRGGHGADDSTSTAASASIVSVSAKSTRHAEKGDDHGRGHGSDDKRADDKGRHGGHDDGPNHT